MSMEKNENVQKQTEAVESGDDYKEGEGGKAGSFVGFVLLSDAQWDLERLRQDLHNDWDLEARQDDFDGEVKGDADSLIFTIDDMIAAVSLMPAPVPGQEAENNAVSNYMWREAVEVTKTHQAHLMVAVLGKQTTLIERGKLFVKIIASCCTQPNVLGIYTSGTVFQPELYRELAGLMRENELPVFNWIWFGLYQNEQGVSAYTYGMEVFGKDEMEILNTNTQPRELRDLLVNIASYVLEEDATLLDGETIGFTEEEKLSITRSEGVSVPGMSLKIG